MAIAFDAVSSGADNPTTALTYSHTCTGSNLILITYVWVEDGADIVTGITYNSVAMTRVDTIQHSGGAKRSYMYYLLNPATGAHNVVVSTSAGDNVHSISASYTGAKQSGQPDSSNKTAQASGATLTLSTTVVASNCWLVSGVGDSNGSAASTGTTERTSGAGVANIGDSNGVVGTGSQSMVWSPGNSGTEEAGIIVSIAPVPDDSGGFFHISS